MTLLADQPGLFDLDTPAPAPAPWRKRARALTHTPRPRRTKEAQAEECEPACLTCGKPEGRGLCHPRCAVICTHTRQPDRVEVCLVTTHVTALLVEGTRTLTGSHQHALVCCPFCGDVHHHAPTYGARYRLSGCGQPYIVHLHRPRITNGAP
ncbi:hypothetical protein GCM10009530_63460 [Microbispora corallina]|uniref:Uncharacterized protein n=1 Tax=Microbispora corallina TaxID=83302 RepID=A0ABQ4GBN8_9ACTN|nr:hypothetical protein [Microbispora corallina]GIH44424.1 hypothetical protein Mco01_74240 [Microbispora corallina]